MSVKADTTGLEYQSPEWLEACAAIERGHRAGKIVNFRIKYGETEPWRKSVSPAWDPDCDYRLAPDPREVWVCFDDNGDLYSVTNYPRHGCIKFREVIE